MAVIAKQVPGGVKSQTSNTTEQVTVAYIIYGAADQTAAKGALLLQAPLTITGELGTLDLKSREVDERRSTGGWYNGTVTYGMPDWGSKPTGETVFTFDTTGGTQHVQHSLANVARYAPGTNTAPDLSGMINVSESSIGGVDITVPNFAFTATMYVAASSITRTFVAALYQLTGKTNNATWQPSIDGIELQFLEGEALYLGATGSRRGGGDVELSHHFVGSENATSLTVGGITGIAKKGHEYLWIFQKQDVVGTGVDAKVVCGAAYVYVEKVYEEADMTQNLLPVWT